MELFVCPEHFIIYIPGILFENTSCVETKRIKNETKDKIRIILTKINKILSKMNYIEIQEHAYAQANAQDLKNSSKKETEAIEKIRDTHSDEIKEYRGLHPSDNIKQVKWVLEGTIDNFNDMYEETADFYNKLSGSYSILHNTSNICNTNNLFTLEKLVLLEQNVEYCDAILLLLENIDSKDNLSFETIFTMENNYMICLIYNLIESIRLYKIEMYKIISL